MILRFVGVFDADGSPLGELAYFVGKHLGRRHCALCDITHGFVSERSDWAAVRDALPAPFVAYHRDDQPDEVRRLAVPLPVVVAEHDDGSLSVVADAATLAACDRSPQRLAALLSAAAADPGPGAAGASPMREVDDADARGD